MDRWAGVPAAAAAPAAPRGGPRAKRQRGENGATAADPMRELTVSTAELALHTARQVRQQQGMLMTTVLQPEGDLVRAAVATHCREC